VRLHPDTARAIAQEQDRRNRPWRFAFVVLACLVLAGLIVFAHDF
jgi:hypothetical protein